MKTQTEMFDNVSGVIRPKDVCARKHGGNTLSTAAFETIALNLTLHQRMVFYEIERRHPYGCTVDELAEILHTTPNAISGRVTELRIRGKITQHGTRKTRSGCNAAVWVVAE